MRSSIPRRDFLKRLPCVGATVAAGVGLSAAGCAGVTYVAPLETPRGLSVSRASLAGSNSVFVQASGMERPIYLSRATSSAWTAVLASCTHRGCQPEPLGDRLVCPCHGSEFSPDGSVLQGPAEAPLRRFEVIEEDGGLVILTGAKR